MPTITFSLSDLNRLVSRRLSTDELAGLLEYGKGEFEGYDKDTDQASVSFDDTNLPYLWSVEGIARLIRHVLGLSKGIEKPGLEKADYSLVVDPSVRNIRPFIAAFVARGKRVDDYLIKQIIQLQEKLCENYGRRRRKIAIGVYSFKNISFPVHYRATDPDEVSFIPLDFSDPLTQRQILNKHPKGREYAFILEGLRKYPILMDDKGAVLSFPPIINSAITGKIEEGEEDLFFEVTGIDLEAVNLACNIFAYALSERGFTLSPVEIRYHDHGALTPDLGCSTIKISEGHIQRILGLSLREAEVKELLERAGYDFVEWTATIPPYRADIMHPCDVIEDLGIVYGYNRISNKPLSSYGRGELNPKTIFIDKLRELVIGLGYQELMSPVLSNKGLLYEKMLTSDQGTVEIEEFMSETYSVVRSWIMPLLLDALSKNKHVSYPQLVFEQGITAVNERGRIRERERLCCLNASGEVNFTVARQTAEYILRSVGIRYAVEACDDPSFTPGRCCRLVAGRPLAIIGELKPDVLEKFGLEMPVAGFEMDVDQLHNRLKEKKQS